MKYPLFILALFFSTVLIQRQWSHINLEHPPTYIPPPQYIHYFHFGYNESLSDSFWLRWIQDADACGRKKIARSSIIPKKQFPRDVAGKANSLNEDVFTPLKDQVCDRGWSFRLLDAITRLAPRFRMPYALGAPTLSILIEDHLGAKIIYERALEHFPDDWKILYRAAYHYLYELNELKIASQLLHRAGETGAPLWVKSLASRVATRAGKIDFGIYSLESYLKHYQRGQTQVFYDTIKERLRSLYLVKGWSEEQIEERWKELLESD